MVITERTAILALAMQSQAIALWADGQHEQALQAERKARALLGLAASNEGLVLGSQDRRTA